MDFNKLMQQAQAMQKQLEATNAQLVAKEYEGSASNGLAKVLMNGEYKVSAVKLDESILNKEDKEMIQDLIMIAFNEAVKKVDQDKKEKFGSLTSSIGI